MIKVIIYVFLLISLQCLSPLIAKEKETLNEFTIGWYFPSINNMISRTDFQTAIDYWVEEFSKPVNIQNSKIRLFDHIKEMQLAFSKGELSLIVAPPLLLVKYFNLDMLSDGFTGISHNGKPYGMVVLARKDKNINKISDFKNKRLILPENDELAHVFLDTLVISQFKRYYSEVFRSVQLEQKQNSIIHSLFFDKADVGVAYLETFNLMIELNPQIKDKIKILESFPINSPNYSFFHTQVPEQLRRFFIAETLKLNHSVKSQQIMSGFRMSAITECSVESLTPFIHLNKKHIQLKKKLISSANNEK